MKKFLREGHMLAVSTEDRRLYSQRLEVWGKKRTYVTQRQLDLIKAQDVSFFHCYYSYALNQCGTSKALVESTPKEGFTINDPFDPYLISDALMMTQSNLGRLIFGEQTWHNVHHQLGLPETALLSQDSLTSFF